MAQNKIISLLSSFSDVDWKHYKGYVSTQTGTSTDYTKLVKYLFKKRKTLSSNWNSEHVRSKLFPHITQKAFLNQMSVLFAWGNESILISRTLKNDLVKNLNLLREYTDRGLYHLCSSLSLKIEKGLMKMDDKTILYHELSNQYYHTLYYSDNPIKYQNGSTLLEKLAHHHILYSNYKNYIYLTELCNWEVLANKDYTQLKNDLIKSSNGRLIPEGHFLRDLYLMVCDTDFEAFNRLQTVLFDYELDVESEVHKLVAFYLIGWSMKFWQRGDCSDSQVITRLYDYGLNSGVLLSAGKIPGRRFHNIISTIDGLRDTGWSFKFIDEWGHKVQSRDPAQSIAFAKAQAYFYREEYEQITPLLRNLKFESDGEQVRMMGLQLIAWFEEREEYRDVFAQYCLAFKRYLKRHKKEFTNHYHDSHMNLIRILEEVSKRGVASGECIYNEVERVTYRVYLKKMFSKPY